MKLRQPRIAYITAGAAGMYCGSCMRDNALASALHRLDVEITLIPTYTPIRTDEENVSLDHIFFGGINVYLQQRLPMFRHLPGLLDRWLDSPGLIRRLARDVETQPEQLGEMTVSMLQGEAGFQSKEVRKLSRWLTDEFRPDLVNLSNILIAGCVPALKKSLPVPVLVTLQGDDVFLESLPEPYKTEAFEQIRQLIPSIDGFVVFSQYYADFMSEYLGIPTDKIHQVPLGINTRDFQDSRGPGDAPSNPSAWSIGYLARLAPEKGLHILVDAFIDLKQQDGTQQVRLLVAGWLGKQHQEYVDHQFRRLDEAGLGSAYEYLGTVDRHQKIDFLRRIDVLSVPTTYRDPKGLFVLEALAAGVPFVQPSHGAFPELAASTNGGRLFAPNDPQDLSRQLRTLLSDDSARSQLGEDGRRAVLDRHNADVMARTTLQVYQKYIQ